METIAPEHSFWNAQIPVLAIRGGGLVSVRFMERFWLASSPLSENILLRLARKDQQAASALYLELAGKIVTVLDCVIEDLLEVVNQNPDYCANESKQYLLLWFEKVSKFLLCRECQQLLGRLNSKMTVIKIYHVATEGDRTMFCATKTTSQ